jgi:hypothetical protein
MIRSRTRTLWTTGALLASLASAPCVFAQTHHAAKTAAGNAKHIVGAGAESAAAAAQAAGQTMGNQPGNGQPAMAPPAGGTMDTAGGVAGTPAAPGYVDTTGTGAYGGQTTTAGGTYDQQTGKTHNWGWIGLFGLLGLLGLRGRTPSTIVEDRTTTARPHVNARP